MTEKSGKVTFSKLLWTTKLKIRRKLISEGLLAIVALHGIWPACLKAKILWAVFSSMKIFVRRQRETSRERAGHIKSKFMVCSLMFYSDVQLRFYMKSNILDIFCIRDNMKRNDMTFECTITFQLEMQMENVSISRMINFP